MKIKKGIVPGPILIVAIIALSLGIFSMFAFTKHIKFYTYEKSGEKEAIELITTYYAIKTSLDKFLTYHIKEVINKGGEKGIPWQNWSSYSQFKSYFESDKNTIYKEGLEEIISSKPILNFVRLNKINFDLAKAEYLGNKIKLNFEFALNLEKKISPLENISDFLVSSFKIEKESSFLSLRDAFNCTKNIFENYKSSSFKYSSLPEQELKAELYDYFSKLISSTSCKKFKIDFLFYETSPKCQGSVKVKIILKSKEGYVIGFIKRVKVNCGENLYSKCEKGKDCLNSDCDAFGYCVSCNKYLEGLPCSKSGENIPVKRREGEYYRICRKTNKGYGCLKGNVKKEKIILNCGENEGRVFTEGAKKIIFNHYEKQISGNYFDLCSLPSLSGNVYLVGEEDGEEYIIKEITIINVLDKCISSLKENLDSFYYTYPEEKITCKQLKNTLTYKLKNIFSSLGCEGYELEVEFPEKCTGKISWSNEEGRKVLVKLELKNKRTNKVESVVYEVIPLYPFIS